MKINELFKKEDNSNIIFKDIYLQLLVGNWLGILDETNDTMQKAYNVSYRYKYANLSNEKLRRKVHISKHKLIEVNKRFREVLNTLGIDANEICVLDNFNETNDTFNCHFENKNEDLKINLNFGDVMGFNKKISIKHNNEEQVYDYVNQNDSFTLKIYHINIKNPKNDNIYTRTYNQFFSDISIENDDYKIDLHISNPKELSFEELKNYNFILNNEDKIREYLLDLEFPIEINKLYKDISSFLRPNPTAIYSTFKITINKKSNVYDLKVTDQIILKNGKLEKVIITRNDSNRITIDNKNNYWKYENDNLTVSQDKNNILNYQFKDHVSKFEIDYLNSMKGNIETINNEVEKVKELSKSL